jgi:hypothetical protein
MTEAKGVFESNPRPAPRRRAAAPSTRSARADAPRPIPGDGARRVIVEEVRPNVDDGRHAVKRTVGEALGRQAQRAGQTPRAHGRSSTRTTPSGLTLVPATV